MRRLGAGCWVGLGGCGGCGGGRGWAAHALRGLSHVAWLAGEMYGPHDFSWVNSEAHCQPDAEIGKGSVGTVYRAHHPTTRQPVAIKKMDRGPLARDPAALHGFQREVDMFSRLNHPNIIRLLDVRMEPSCHLLIMEEAECELCVQARLSLRPHPLPHSPRTVRVVC